MDTAVATSKKSTVQSIYGEAAKAPAGLCCPQSYQSELLSHVPKAALDRNYGCGSPLLKAGVKQGDVLLDLGSGVGIDCFVAARMVGKTGKVIGVDMTDDMLSQAAEFNQEVARNLGYDVVEFRKGIIEELPVADNSVDLVISNCVLNLSSNKDQVLKEILRVLKPGGRMVISDIVSDREIDEEDQDNEVLWAECYTGAIPVGRLVSTYEDVGFLGLTQLAETPWRELEGYNFGSLTLRAFKLPQSKECNYGGHIAVYLGPYASVRDEENHEFARFEAVEVCDATAERLRLGPYAESFTVVDVPALARAASSCGTGACGTGSSCATDSSCGTGSGCAPGSCGPATAEASSGAGAGASPCCDPTDSVSPCCENNQPKADGSPCCDTLAPGAAASCGTSCGAPAATTVGAAQAAQATQAALAKASSTAASACCDSGSSCGTGSSCGPGAGAATAATSAAGAAQECCPCDTEAKAEGSACCGSGCGDCGCS